ncbi:hypothetical protein N7486_002087 [Penicillium sp. IBT 16267x]|nr:hypothetical protein N7486_002087 [Penicillium sp. IBT 16267x]
MTDRLTTRLPCVVRSTHIHVTVQTNVSGQDTSYSDAAVQHLGQWFFAEELFNKFYQEPYYVEHLTILNCTTNAED